MSSSLGRRLGALALTAGLVTAVPLPAAAAEPCLASSPARPTCIGGTLADGTAYRFAVPAHWNGIVLVDLDFADGQLETPLTAALLERGYARGGTTRLVSGWDLRRAVDNQAEALSAFEAAAGPARSAVAAGGSMGGFVAAGVAQEHPGRFAGALSLCGGLSGSVGQWNQKLDTVFTLKTLLFPGSALPVTGIPEDVAGSRTAWFTALAGAQATPAGRARIALAAAVGQLPTWGLAADGSPTPRARAHDVTGLQQGMYQALAGGPLPYIGQAMGSRRQIELLTGGNPSWNTEVDYARQVRLARPEVRHALQVLYRRAGLDLAADLRRLAAAPRVAADPAAVARFARGLVFTGELRVPVLTVTGIGDQIATLSQQQAYEALVRSRGHGGLLRQTYVTSAGHCAFTTGEYLAAVAVLTARLRTGHWPSVTPGAMNARAAALDPASAPGRYLAYRPERFNRPFPDPRER